MNKPAPASSVQTENSIESSNSSFQRIRIWPAALLLVAMAATKFVPLMLKEESTELLIVMVFGPLLIGILLMAWWIFFSRASRGERIIVPIVCTLSVLLTTWLCDQSLQFENSLFGPGLLLVMIPMGISAFTIGAIFCHRLLSFNRTWIALLMAVCGFGFTGLLKSDGMWGNGVLDLSWRWTTSAEEKLLKDREGRSRESLANVAENQIAQWLTEPEWPRFRGANGQSRYSGPALNTDWSSNPPEEVWRIPVGPGWASFAVAGNLLFTQEQYGDQESIVCYARDSGKEIWAQSLESRFSDPLGGPGPRATPTLADGKLYALGAKGQLQCLDPQTGEVIWQKDIREPAKREPPAWGYSSSPLVVDSVVVVHAGGEGDKGILAFDAVSGDPAWSAASGDHSYSSPELCTINGTTYIAMLSNTGLNLVDPSTGQSQLDYEWKCAEYRALQPQVIDGNAILIPTQDLGTRLVRIEQSESGLSAVEVWTSRNLKPDFNDFVIFENHAYGFDGSIFTCIDLATGDRKWKRGRYGKGQVLLLENTAALLIVSEKGQLILLDANPSAHQELAKLTALNDRTWNHPVVVGNQLLIRNSEEAVSYFLPLAKNLD